MLYVLPDSAGDILVLQASGTLIQSDYDDIFLPQIAKQLKPGHKLRILLYLDHDFTEIDLSSHWNASQFIPQSEIDIIRMAVVSDGVGDSWSQSFDSGISKTFRVVEFLNALHWCDDGQL